MDWGARLNTKESGCCLYECSLLSALQLWKDTLWPAALLSYGHAPPCQVWLYPGIVKPLLQWLLFECFVPVMPEGADAQPLFSRCQKIPTPSRSGPLLWCWILIMCASVITFIAFRFFFSHCHLLGEKQMKIFPKVPVIPRCRLGMPLPASASSKYPCRLQFLVFLLIFSSIRRRVSHHSSHGKSLIQWD